MQEKAQKISPIKQRILQFADTLGISKRDFYAKIGVSRGTLEAKTGITEEIMAKFIATFPDISVDWLVTGRGNKFNTKTPEIRNISNVPNIVPDIVPVPKLQKNGTFAEYQDCLEKQGGSVICEYTLIPIVDITAAAGGGAYNSDYINEEDVIRLPHHMVNRGFHQCIRIKGQSMAPTFQDGGYIINRLLDRGEWLDIREQHVYVVTDREGKTYIKRLKNRLKEHGFIVCTSDNPDKANFPNFNLMEDELCNVWEVEWYMTAKMPNIHETYYTKVQRLEDDMDELKSLVHKLLP